MSHSCSKSTHSPGPGSSKQSFPLQLNSDLTIIECVLSTEFIEFYFTAVFSLFAALCCATCVYMLNIVGQFAKQNSSRTAKPLLFLCIVYEEVRECHCRHSPGGAAATFTTNAFQYDLGKDFMCTKFTILSYIFITMKITMQWKGPVQSAPQFPPALLLHYQLLWLH